MPKPSAQLDREIDEALRKPLRSSAVMIVARPKDWDLLEESLRLDADSSAFDAALRWRIREALDALEVGTTHQGRKVVVRAKSKDWELLDETLRVDAQSSRLPKHDREDLQAAIKRLVVKPWPNK